MPTPTHSKTQSPPSGVRRTKFSGAPGRKADSLTAKARLRRKGNGKGRPRGRRAVSTRLDNESVLQRLRHKATCPAGDDAALGHIFRRLRERGLSVYDVDDEFFSWLDSITKGKVARRAAEKRWRELLLAKRLRLFRRAWLRARKRHPELSLPSITSPRDPSLRQIAPERAPRLARQLQKFKERAAKGKDKLAPLTIKSYVGSVNIIAAALAADGMPIDDHFGIEDLADPKVVQAFLLLEEKRKAKRAATRAKLAGLARIAADTLRKGHKHVIALRARAHRRQVRPGLSLDQLKMLDSLVTPIEFQRFYFLPKQLLSVASDRHEHHNHRRVVATAAIVLAILLDLVGFGPHDLHDLKIGKEIFSRDGRWFVLAPALQKEAAAEELPLSSRTCKIMDKVLLLRREFGQTEEWLFAGPHGDRAKIDAATQKFNDTVTRYWGSPFTYQIIPDIATVLLLKEEETHTDVAAVLRRNEDPRTPERRFRALLGAGQLKP